MDGSRGAVLVTSLLVMVVLSALGIAAITTATLETYVSSNYRTAREAFYIAEAGLEHGRERLRSLNAASAAPDAFTDELRNAAGANGLLDGLMSGTDDVPLIRTTTFGKGSYLVYLRNDVLDNPANPLDSNGKIALLSVGTGPNGSQIVVEATISLFPLFPLPGTITLLGSGAGFLSTDDPAKALRGDDQCGAKPPGPVVAVSDAADVGRVQNHMAATAPDTYLTRDAIGNVVTAQTNPDATAAAIAPATLNDIATTYGLNLHSPAGLQNLVTTLHARADSTAPGDSSTLTVDVGTPANPRLVVVTGDFALDSDGAGVLVVTGRLTFRGDLNYTGLILAIGSGEVRRTGAQGGSLSGGIMVANTRGPDNLPGTADDTTVLGPPTFDISAGGSIRIVPCTTAVNAARSIIPLRTVAYRHL